VVVSVALHGDETARRLPTGRHGGGPGSRWCRPSPDHRPSQV